MAINNALCPALDDLAGVVPAQSKTRCGSIVAKKIGQAERVASMSPNCLRPTRLAVSPTHLLAAYDCNYGAERMCVECKAVCRFVRGACPETPHNLGV